MPVITSHLAAHKRKIGLLDNLVRRRTRKVLAEFDDHMFRDIGLSRDDLQPSRFRTLWLGGSR